MSSSDLCGLCGEFFSAERRIAAVVGQIARGTTARRAEVDFEDLADLGHARGRGQQQGPAPARSPRRQEGRHRNHGRDCAPSCPGPSILVQAFPAPEQFCYRHGYLYKITDFASR